MTNGNTAALDRQPRAAFLASAGQHLPAVSRGHPGAESVLAFTFFYRRVIGALHGIDFLSDNSLPGKELI